MKGAPSISSEVAVLCMVAVPMGGAVPEMGSFIGHDGIPEEEASRGRT